MPARSPLVTFIVPCFNYGRYVAECLGGIFAQTVQDFEVLVIDDHSTDCTPDVLSRVRDRRVKIITHEQNRGLVFTLTEGYSLATGTFVARVDADDRYRPHFLDATLPMFERYPEAGLVYGDVASMDEDGRVLEDPWPGIRSREVHNGHDFFGDEFLQHVEDNLVPAAAVIGRREAWQRALPFPDWFTFGTITDWYLNIRVAREYPVAYHARTLADYRLHHLNLHRQISRDRTPEGTVINILDEMLAGDDRRNAKARVRRRLYARAYLRAADQYFSADLSRDARRCYLRAMSYRPDFVLRPAPLRHLAATFVSRRAYDAVKRALADRG